MRTLFHPLVESDSVIVGRAAGPLPAYLAANENRLQDFICPHHGYKRRLQKPEPQN